MAFPTALQNPLSQLGILVLRNGVAERLTDISGSPEAQVRRLEGAALGGWLARPLYMLGWLSTVGGCAGCH